jgi:hypothetical protein
VFFSSCNTHPTRSIQQQPQTPQTQQTQTATTTKLSHQFLAQHSTTNNNNTRPTSHFLKMQNKTMAQFFTQILCSWKG